MTEPPVRGSLRELIGPIVGTIVFFFLAPGIVLLYEEPVLRARFGADYAEYSAAVRRWWPRLHPWRAGS